MQSVCLLVPGLLVEFIHYFAMNNLENWDSLGHLKLLSEVEQQFKIKFSNKEIPVITDEKKILSLLINKLRLKI